MELSRVQNLVYHTDIRTVTTKISIQRPAKQQLPPRHDDE
jgi:hypothetical protein